MTQLEVDFRQILKVGAGIHLLEFWEHEPEEDNTRNFEAIVSTIPELKVKSRLEFRLTQEVGPVNLSFNLLKIQEPTTQQGEN